MKVIHVQPEFTVVSVKQHWGQLDSLATVEVTLMGHCLFSSVQCGKTYHLNPVPPKPQTPQKKMVYPKLKKRKTRKK